MDAWKPASPASLHVLSPGRAAAGRLEVQRKLEQPTHNAFRMLKPYTQHPTVHKASYRAINPKPETPNGP